MNSSVNCFLYTLFSSQFRKGGRNIFQVCRKDHQAEIEKETNRHYANKTEENSRSVEQSNLEVFETRL